LYQPYQTRQDFRGRLLLTIEGDEQLGIAPLHHMLQQFQGWLDAGCLTIRYEDLIGSSGGGQQDHQIEVVRSIFDFLKIPLKSERLENLCRELFSEVSPTFRTGQTGQWVNYFDPEIMTSFKRTVGQLVIRYGYESDLDW
jgi:hypothetical protein